jgi:hypothetical protein
VVWIAPTANIVQTFVARPVDGGIYIEGVAPNGHHLRWSWSDLKPDSFTYRSEDSGDAGKTWFLEEQVWATRRR